jgi:hypothetical protein
MPCFVDVLEGSATCTGAVRDPVVETGMIADYGGSEGDGR